MVTGGTFTQTNGSQSFTHTISTFYIGQYEVTYELWYMVRNWAIINGYKFANAGREGNDGVDGAAPTAAKYEPVTRVNWRDMIVWCNAYSEMIGYTPVYYSDAEFTTPIKDSTDGVYGNSINTTPGSFDNPYVKWTANGYRLPTEGEWEYAARYIDGTDWLPYNYASGAQADYTVDTATASVAWYKYNSGFITRDTGLLYKNALEIYDMSGNVWEWCWDWYAAYPGASVTDYKGPASGSFRIFRGGGFSNDGEYLKTGFRYYISPYDEYNHVGFRLANTAD
jgi:formylglycine-generating enzyme required for sulfatase activity